MTARSDAARGLLAEAERLYWSGNIRGLISDAPSVHERLAAALPDLAGASQLFGRVLCAELSLLLAKPGDSVAALGPLIVLGTDGSLVPQEAGIDPESFAPEYAFFYSVVAALTVRRQPSRGFEYARRAANSFSLLRERGSESERIRVALGAAINETRLARFELPLGVAPDSAASVERLGAAHRLEACIEGLVGLYNAVDFHPEFKGRLNLAVSDALSLSATVDWNSGTLDSARRKINRALFLLGDGPDDPIAFGSTLLTAARIESSRPGSWALYLSRRAKEVLREVNHPHSYRALIAEASCLVKMSRTSEARRLLSSFRPEEAPEDDREFIASEVDIVSIWILEREAEAASSSDRTREWMKCAEKAKELLERSYLTARQRVEALYHVGRAASMNPDTLELGISLLEDALARAERQNRRKLVAIAHLALAEGNAGNPSAFRSHVEEAKVLSSQVNSSYISEWVESLPAAYGSRLTVELDRPWADVESQVRREFARFALQRYDDSEPERTTRTGVSSVTLKRMLVGRPESERPRPHKPPKKPSIKKAEKSPRKK